MLRQPRAPLLRKAATCLAAAAALVAFVACDPCAGVASCANGRYLAAVGQIVDGYSGKGIAGVRIDVVRTAGVQVGTDSLSAVTDDGGFWRVEFAPDSSGTMFADIRVSPPNYPPYLLRQIRLETKSHNGDANLNERWVPYLYFKYVGEFFLNGTQDQRVQGATVQFRRTAGAVLSGPGIQNDSFTSLTDAGGRVYFFPMFGDSSVFAADNQPVVADLIIRLPQSADSTVLRGVELTPRSTFFYTREFAPVIRYPVGP
jgi:hypothetical protein